MSTALRRRMIPVSNNNNHTSEETKREIANPYQIPKVQERFISFLAGKLTVSTMTSSWPWMKGINVAIADPISPVTPNDARESVKGLIAQHRNKIDQIKAEISKENPMYVPAKHDDLWILRFWLSHKNLKKAAKAARHTLQFRQNHSLDDADIRKAPPHKVTDGLVKEYWSTKCSGDAIIFAIPDPNRGVIGFLEYARIDHKNALKNLPSKANEYGFIYSSEFSHQWCDFVTRTTGRLTKSIRFIDMRGFGFSSFNREASKKDATIMNSMEDCYPQLLDHVLIHHAPEWIHMVFAIMRPILPKRVVDKIDIINPIKNEKERRRLLEYVKEEDLPTFLGGKNERLPKDW